MRAFESIVTPPVYMYMYTHRVRPWLLYYIHTTRIIPAKAPVRAPLPLGCIRFFFLGCERKTPHRQWWLRRWVFTAAAGNWCQFDGRPSFTPPLPPSHRTYAYISIPFAPLHPSSNRRGYTTAALLQ